MNCLNCRWLYKNKYEIITIAANQIKSNFKFQSCQHGVYTAELVTPPQNGKVLMAHPVTQCENESRLVANLRWRIAVGRVMRGMKKSLSQKYTVTKIP